MELKEEIRKVKLAIKNGRKMALEALKGEQDARRELEKVSRVKERKHEDRLHIQREMQEIKELIPQVCNYWNDSYQLVEAIKNAKARIVSEAAEIKLEVQSIESLKSDVIPKIHTAITEIQVASKLFVYDSLIVRKRPTCARDITAIEEKASRCLRRSTFSSGIE